jgi:hypothetical protein
VDTVWVENRIRKSRQNEHAVDVGVVEGATELQHYGAMPTCIPERDLAGHWRHDQYLGSTKTYCKSIEIMEYLN